MVDETSCIFIFENRERELTIDEKVKMMRYISEHQSSTFGEVAAHFEKEFGEPVTTSAVFGVMLLMKARHDGWIRGVK